MEKFSIEFYHMSSLRETIIRTIMILHIGILGFISQRVLCCSCRGNDFGDQLKELQSTLDDYEDLVSSLSKSKKVLIHFSFIGDCFFSNFIFCLVQESRVLGNTSAEG